MFIDSDMSQPWRTKQTAQPDSFPLPTVLSSVAWVCQEKSLRPYGNKRASGCGSLVYIPSPFSHRTLVLPGSAED